MSDLQIELVRTIAVIITLITVLIGFAREWRNRSPKTEPRTKDEIKTTTTTSKEPWILWVSVPLCIGFLISEGLSNDPVSRYDVIRISFLVFTSTFGIMVIGWLRRP